MSDLLENDTVMTGFSKVSGMFTAVFKQTAVLTEDETTQILQNLRDY
jgi:hypothetical protein